jgi:hypothetical protein
MKKPKGLQMDVRSFFPFVPVPSYEFSPDASEGLRVIARGIKTVFLANPEATIAAAAFLVGMFSPRYEATCERVAVESLKALAERQKREAQAEAKQNADLQRAFAPEKEKRP